MKATVDDLLKERGQEYGPSWKTTGMMILPVADQLNEFLRRFPYAYFSWVMILNKLTRLLQNPFKKDSWRDIIGYATLVLNHLEQMDAPTEGGVNGKIC